MFWLLVTALGILADLAMPLLWSVAAMLPIFLVSWWIVYRSGWF